MEKALSHKRRRLKNRGDHLFCWSLYAWPLFIWFTLGFCGNYIGSFVLAFENIDYLGNVTFAGFNNFVKFVQMFTKDGDLLAMSAWYSLLMYLLNLVFSTFFNYLFAYMIFKKCPGHKIWRIICFIPAAVSGMIFGLCFQKFVSTALPEMLVNLGITTEYIDMFSDPKYIFFILNFYMLWTGFTNAIVIVPNAMAAVSPELYEAGQLDGIHNMFQELWYIVLPGIWPTISTFFIAGVSSLFMSGGVTLLFYNLSAPDQAYNLGYFYTLLTLNGDETLYPVLAAGGLVMTALCAPLTFLVKWLCNKCPWSED